MASKQLTEKEFSAIFAKLPKVAWERVIIYFLQNYRHLGFSPKSVWYIIGKTFVGISDNPALEE
jgi:hypothetical protein